MTRETGGTSAEIIRSVSGYLDQVLPKDDVEFYRGECEDFGGTTCVSSALREEKTLRNWRKHVKSFKHEAYFSITEEEREHEIAFARHYGIKTNLLDITANPLVALYLACDGGDSQNGVVYLFDGDYIRFSDIARSVDNDFDFQLYVSELAELADKKIDLSGAAIKDSELQKNLKKTLNKFEEYNRSSGRLDKYTTRLQDFLEPWLERHGEKRDLSFSETIDGISDGVSKYLHLLATYFSLAPEIKKEAGKIQYENFIPNLLYRPLINYKRGIQQSSAFFYQVSARDKPSYSLVDHSLHTIFNITNAGRIKVDGRKKEDILKELDKLNINVATVYGDLDSIAEHVQRKE